MNKYFTFFAETHTCILKPLLFQIVLSYIPEKGIKNTI